MATTGVRRHARLETARTTLLQRVRPHGRVETVPLPAADGRVVADRVVADRNVPHYRRAAMDGYAVRAADTEGASEADPAVLELGESVEAGVARRVHTGSQLPDGADAVARVERVERRGDSIAVLEPIPEGKDVAPAGEDVAAGEVLFESGDRLGPADLGVLRSVGVGRVPVVERPTVAVLPTGEELVGSDPDPGEVVESNGRIVASFVRRWGGDPRLADPVDDDPATLRSRIRRAASADLVVTTGGSSVGERDLVPEAVGEEGDLLVDGVAIRPGHPVSLGVVDGTPVSVLPGYPVSCVVTAVQLLRPAVYRAAGADPPSLPSVRASLVEGIESDRGTRRFERVRLDEGGARPVDRAGAGALSTVTRSDGWVVVGEDRTELTAGETVSVRQWTP